MYVLSTSHGERDASTISIIIPSPSAFNLEQKKKKEEKKSESRIYPRAPISVVLKLLRGTSRAHPGAAEPIRFIQG